jgi:hypothetical protein
MLKELRKQFEMARDPIKQTTEDKIHEENLKHGQNKYKTLRNSHYGHAKRRVDAYDSM